MTVDSAARDKLTPAFVGRVEPMIAVTEALDAGRATVLVEGEAGIGKTRLIHEWLTSARPGREVVVSACPPLREPLPLGPIVAGLRGLKPSVGDLSLSPLSGALRPLLPEWSVDLPPALEPLEDPHATRQRVFAAVAELFDALGTEVLVVEDAQWADTSTIEFLLVLSAQHKPAISLVLTYRPEDVPADSALRRLFSRSPSGMSATRIELAPLTRAETRQLVGSMLGAEKISDEFVALLHERTSGLPLALEESVLLLTERRDVFRRGAEWARRTLDRLRVPATVRDLVLERAARLGPEAQRVLETSAVLAEPATAEVLADAAALGAGEARRGLSAALAANLLSETSPGRFAFRHMLAMLAVYEAVPVSERRRLHADAARRLEQLTPQPIPQLARHHREAHQVPAWARYAEAAADLAAETGNHQAVTELLYDLLVEARLPADQFGRLARKLGEAAAVAAAADDGTTRRVSTLLGHAVARDDLEPVDRGRLRLLRCGLLIDLCQLDAAYAEVERSVPDLADAPLLAARAMIGLAWPWLGGRGATEHRAWLDRAAEILPQLPSSSERNTLMADRATALLMLGDDAGWRAADDLPTGASTAAARRELARGYANLSQVAAAWGRYGPARAWHQRTAELVDSTAYPQMYNIVRISSADMDYRTGAWAEAEATAAELAEAVPLNRLGARLIQGLLALAGGATHSAEQALREVIDGLDVSRLADDRLAAEAALARLQLAGGAAADAVATTDSSMRTVTATGLWLWATDLVQVRVDALVASGCVDRAEAVLRQYGAWTADRDAPAPSAAALGCRARVAEAHGDRRRAAELFGRASRAWAELPRPYDALLAAERRGHCLLALGDDEEALAALTETQQALFDLGARWDADRIARVLRERDVEVARTWRGGRRGYGDQLSPRELEVVRLVVTGLTNRQVAESLFISPRTVAEHVSRAMRKLGVTSRTALASAATRTGVLTDTSDLGGQSTP